MSAKRFDWSGPCPGCGRLLAGIDRDRQSFHEFPPCRWYEQQTSNRAALAGLYTLDPLTGRLTAAPKC